MVLAISSSSSVSANGKTFRLAYIDKGKTRITESRERLRVFVVVGIDIAYILALYGWISASGWPSDICSWIFVVAVIPFTIWTIAIAGSKWWTNHEKHKRAAKMLNLKKQKTKDCYKNLCHAADAIRNSLKTDDFEAETELRIKAFIEDEDVSNQPSMHLFIDYLGKALGDDSAKLYELMAVIEGDMSNQEKMLKLIDNLNELRRQTREDFKRTYGESIEQEKTQQGQEKRHAI